MCLCLCVCVRERETVKSIKRCKYQIPLIVKVLHFFVSFISLFLFVFNKKCFDKKNVILFLNLKF